MGMACRLDLKGAVDFRNVFKTGLGPMVRHFGLKTLYLYWLVIHKRNIKTVFGKRFTVDLKYPKVKVSDFTSCKSSSQERLGIFTQDVTWCFWTSLGLFKIFHEVNTVDLTWKVFGSIHSNFSLLGIVLKIDLLWWGSFPKQELLTSNVEIIIWGRLKGT